MVVVVDVVDVEWVELGMDMVVGCFCTFFLLVVFTISMVGGVIHFDCTGQIFSNSCSLVIFSLRALGGKMAGK